MARQARAAWQRLKKEKSWGDWIVVGEGLTMWREDAMREAGTNQPAGGRMGKGYNLAFAKRLADNKLDDMDQGDRKRLFDCMDNIGPIEEWRRTLPQTTRLKLNHPTTVWRAWRHAMEPATAPAGEAKPTLRDSVASLSEELEASRAHAAELQAALDAAAKDADLALTIENLCGWVAAQWRNAPHDERMSVVTEVTKALGLDVRVTDPAQPQRAPAARKRPKRKGPAAPAGAIAAAADAP